MLSLYISLVAKLTTEFGEFKINLVVLGSKLLFVGNNIKMLSHYYKYSVGYKWFELHNFDVYLVASLSLE